jgi:outer membrane protein OmpU
MKKRGKKMKNILLTTTALVMTAGVAAADGNISMTGTASAGMAREGSALFVAGDMETYAEVNLTASASVETDGGVGMSMGFSIDGGTGYDFADDDGFDGAKTNGAGLDHIDITGGFGSLKIDASNGGAGAGGLAMLVDGDDETGDIAYNGNFAGIGVSIVADLSDDDSASPSVDTQWSLALSGSAGEVSWRAAADEEGGYAAKVSTTMGGVSLSVDTKIEAAAVDANGPANNGLDVSYTTAGITVSANYDSVKDNDQYGYGISYSTGAMTMGYSTDEDSDWTATASYDLGAGATIAAGANYTKDAYLGVSFSF